MTDHGRSRRGAAHWARPHAPASPQIDVLIPTAGRSAALAVTLSGLAAQDAPRFRVTLSDQSEERVAETDPVVLEMIRLLRAQGREVQVHRHMPRRGLAEQRQFLLGLARAPRVLYLDDDVWLEPGALARLSTSLDGLRCGFVGYAVQGLSYLDDVRPEETRRLEMWRGGVQPERVRRHSPGFERWPLHNAANLAHLAAELDLSDEDRVPYRVAWIGGCVLFERRALEEAGGFDFWDRLPSAHAGEDAAAQWRVMERYGGAGILPSGAVHLEAPTTVVNRDVEATDVVFSEETTKPRYRKEKHHERSTAVHRGAEVPERSRLSREPRRAASGRA